MQNLGGQTKSIMVFSGVAYNKPGTSFKTAKERETLRADWFQWLVLVLLFYFCSSAIKDLRQLPEQWLQSLLDDLTSTTPLQALCGTRRSAGVPFFILVKPQIMKSRLRKQLWYNIFNIKMLDWCKIFACPCRVGNPFEMDLQVGMEWKRLKNTFLCADVYPSFYFPSCFRVPRNWTVEVRYGHVHATWSTFHSVAV